MVRVESVGKLGDSTQRGELRLRAEAEAEAEAKAKAKAKARTGIGVRSATYSRLVSCQKHSQLQMRPTWPLELRLRLRRNRIAIGVGNRLQAKSAAGQPTPSRDGDRLMTKMEWSGDQLAIEGCD